jgi:hypothetical protein
MTRMVIGPLVDADVGVAHFGKGQDLHLPLHTHLTCKMIQKQSHDP